MLRVKRYSLILLMVFCGVDYSFAGFIWTTIDSHSDSQIAHSRGGSTWYVEGEKIRTEIWSESKGIRSVSLITIIRKDKNVIWSINPEKNQYSERTQADSQALDLKMEKEGKVMEAKARKMWTNASQEERETMEKALEDRHDFAMQQTLRMMRGEASMDPTFAFKPTGQIWKVKKWQCQVYEYFRSNEKIGDVCVIDGNKIIPGLGDVARSKRKIMASFHAGELLSGLTAMEDAEEKGLGRDRFVLKQVHYIREKLAKITEFVEAKNDPISPSLFDLPKGAVKTEKLWGSSQPKTPIEPPVK